MMDTTTLQKGMLTDEEARAVAMLSSLPTPGMTKREEIGGGSTTMRRTSTAKGPFPLPSGNAVSVRGSMRKRHARVDFGDEEDSDEQAVEKKRAAVVVKRNSSLPQSTEPVSTSKAKKQQRKRSSFLDLEGENSNDADARDDDDDKGSEKRRNRGLFVTSKAVVELMQQKGTSTYVEIADALIARTDQHVTEGRMPSPYPTAIRSAVDGSWTWASSKDDLMLPHAQADSYQVDNKNIRRRVYDVLNVLIACDAVEKSNNRILTWRGFPKQPRMDEIYPMEASFESAWDALSLDQVTERISRAGEKKDSLEKSIAGKKQELRDLLNQHLCVRALISRNQKWQRPNPLTSEEIPLPFIVVNTNKETSVECEMTHNKADLFMNFSRPFEIHDDNDILRRLELDFDLIDDDQLRRIVPANFQKYVLKSLPEPISRRLP